MTDLITWMKQETEGHHPRQICIFYMDGKFASTIRDENDTAVAIGGGETLAEALMDVIEKDSERQVKKRIRLVKDNSEEGSDGLFIE